MSASQLSASNVTIANIESILENQPSIVLDEWCPLIIGSAIHVIGLTASNDALLTSHDIKYICADGRFVVDSQCMVYQLVGPPVRSLIQQWANSGGGGASMSQVNYRPPVESFFEACNASLSDSWPRLAIGCDNEDTGHYSSTDRAVENLDNDSALLNDPTERLILAQASTTSVEASAANTTLAVVETTARQDGDSEGTIAEPQPDAETDPVITPPPEQLGSKLAKIRASLAARATQNNSPTVSSHPQQSKSNKRTFGSSPSSSEPSNSNENSATRRRKSRPIKKRLRHNDSGISDLDKTEHAENVISSVQNQQNQQFHTGPRRSNTIEHDKVIGGENELAATPSGSTDSLPATNKQNAHRAAAVVLNSVIEAASRATPGPSQSKANQRRQSTARRAASSRVPSESTNTQSLRNRPRFSQIPSEIDHSTEQENSIVASNRRESLATPSTEGLSDAENRIRRNGRRHCQIAAPTLQFLSPSVLRSMRRLYDCNKKQKRRKTLPA